MSELCLICRKPVPDYVPEYCCDGSMCGCHGQPVNPCVCSERCYDAVMQHIGHEFDERRKLAGIDLWKPRRNRPLDYIHDVAVGYGRLLLPIPFSGGRWLMITKRGTIHLTWWKGFHNCTATGVF